MTPKISIITTIYNAENDLPRLLESMKSIKNDNIEFFLIENGSCDSSYNICLRYAAEDSRFSVYHIERNVGYIRARNIGIEKCSGEYIGFCDSDDYLSDIGYEQALDKIEETNCDLFLGSYCIVKGNQKKIMKVSVADGIYSDQGLQKISPLFFGDFNGMHRLNGYVWKNIYKRDVIIRNNIYFIDDIKPAEEQIFNLEAFRGSKSVVIDNIILYYYVFNPLSITAQVNKEFSASENCKRISNLHREYKKYLVSADEFETESNYMLFSLYKIAVNCAKSQAPINFNVEQIKSAITSDLMDEMLAYCKQKRNIKMQFVKFCLKRKLYKLLIGCLKLCCKLNNAWLNLAREDV